jgi:hypothetical protein
VIRTNVYCHGFITSWRGYYPIIKSAGSGASDCKTASGHLPGGSEPQKESDEVLQQFLQWRQKANPGETAQ